MRELVMTAEAATKENIVSDESIVPAERPMAASDDTKKQEKRIIEKKDTGKEAEKNIISTSAPEATTSKRKSQVVNSRLNKYRIHVTAIVEKSKNNPLSAQAQSFLADPVPLYERLTKLVTDILQNRAPKTTGSKLLTKAQVYDLLQSVICYYLDKICFNGKDSDKLSELKKIFEKLRKAKVKVEAIYEYWNLSEIKKYEPELNEKEVISVFGIGKK
jgi:hypothetical protein